MANQSSAPLSVIHVLRTPVGGLFRHVCDLARMQSEMGMSVGIFCDSTTGGQNADTILDQLNSHCSLGIHRIPIGRLPGFGDWAAVCKLRHHLKNNPPDILHGHGAKGGAYARLLGHSIGAKSFYTPHGGSLHYQANTVTGFIFLKLERLLSHRTSGIIFECAFSKATYQQKIGTPDCAMQIIHNGIGAGDFYTAQHQKNASDFVFIGELRKLKGVDILLRALAQLAKTGLPCSCTIIGDGPDTGTFKQLAGQLNLGSSVKFAGFKPASEGFSSGRHLVIPSRAEAFPYIILEGAAAGLPVITTNVGGIAEMFGDQAAQLVPPDDVESLAATLQFALTNPYEMQARAEILHQRVKECFTVSTMAAATVDFYSSV